MQLGKGDRLARLRRARLPATHEVGGLPPPDPPALYFDMFQLIAPPFSYFFINFRRICHFSIHCLTINLLDNSSSTFWPCAVCRGSCAVSWRLVLCLSRASAVFVVFCCIHVFGACGAEAPRLRRGFKYFSFSSRSLIRLTF